MGYLGLIFLFLLPGELYAQSADQFCSAPSLDGGYFTPEREHYSQGSRITYACNEGRKPAVEGWWATVSCEGGQWLPVPQCIEETSCLQPKIANAEDTSIRDWYKHGKSVTVTCKEGYEVLNQDAPAECLDGSWSSVPVCEIIADACREPPQIPHAVVVGQNYKEVFATGSVVQYECENGYTVEGAPSTKSITCSSGDWSDGPNCIKQTTEDTGRGAGTSGRQTGGRTQTVGGDRGTTANTGRDQPTTGGRGTQQGGSRVEGTAGGHSTSSGSVTPTSGGGSSTGDSRPLTIPVGQCGQPPVVLNGVLVQKESMFLKYQCNSFYKLVGQENVVCFFTGSWSDPPRCQEDFCTVNAAQFSEVLGKPQTGNLFIQKGEEGTHVPCVWNHYTSLFKCENGVITYSRCCQAYYHKHERCQTFRL